MPSTDKEPKGKTNEKIVHYLQRGNMHFCALLQMHVGTKIRSFELRTDFEGSEYRFEAAFLDGTGTKVLAAETNKDYARAKALASLLDDKCFPSVEAWVVACRNALGDNIDTFPLAGAIFVDGQCVDDLIDAADAAAAAKATEEKNLAAQVEQMQEHIDILTQIVTELCAKAGRRKS